MQRASEPRSLKTIRMRVLTNAFWLSVCRFGSDALSFVLFAAIGRAFGPVGTGEYSYAFAISSVLVLLCSGGFEEYGTRQYARASEAERPRLWRELFSAQIVRLGVMLTLFAVFLGIAARGEFGARVSIVIELAVFLVGWGLARVLFTPAMGLQVMVRPAFTELGCRVAAIIVALALWLMAVPSLPLMLIGFPLSSLVLLWLAVRNAASHGAHLPPVRMAGVWQMTRETFPFAAADVLNQFYARADMLLIAYLMSRADVGLYATDVKFVEVGLLPLVLLGTAAYPLLSRYAAVDKKDFTDAAHDLVRTTFLFSGWLAVGLCTVVPLLIVPIFGPAFEPAAAHLPWFAALALTKGGEIAMFRLLYSVQLQGAYVLSLVAGTVLIVILNFVLISSFGIQGAVVAGICSVGMVAALCAWRLRQHIALGTVFSVLARLAVTLAVTAGLFFAGERAGLSPWLNAVGACALFPLVAFGAGLVLNPVSSRLFKAQLP